ncbi:MAG: hypothetical protein JNL96_03240 [Planctomycetaceae bacterium]|nr:hypothetical protein [Planctomycetaceae bacterium]
MADVDPRHGPNRSGSCFAIHKTILSQARATGFVCGDAIEFTDFDTFFTIEGEIGCLGEIVISVSKILEVVSISEDNQRLVQTSSYSYNVLIRGGHNIFRYDNNHPESPHPGHHTIHHKHEFDWQTGDEFNCSPRCIGHDWPHLGEVIAEASDWYYANRSLLKNPNRCAEDLQSDVTR